MKKKLISLGIISLITAVLIFVGVATGAVSYRVQKDNMDFRGNVLLSGTSVEFTGTTVVVNSSTLALNGRIQKSWYTPNFKRGTGFTISGTTMLHSYFKIDTSGTSEKGGGYAPGYPLSPSGATIVLPQVTADLDGVELTFMIISGTTKAWFIPASGTIQTTSGTTGLNISSQPDLTGDSVTWVAAYGSGVSWYVKSTFIQ